MTKLANQQCPHCKFIAVSEEQLTSKNFLAITKALTACLQLILKYWHLRYSQYTLFYLKMYAVNLW